MTSDEIESDQGDVEALMRLKFNSKTKEWENAQDVMPIVVLGYGDVGFSFQGYTIKGAEEEDGVFAMGLLFHALPENASRSSGDRIEEGLVIQDGPVLHEIRFSNVESVRVLQNCLEGVVKYFESRSAQEQTP